MSKKLSLLEVKSRKGSSPAGGSLIPVRKPTLEFNTSIDQLPSMQYDSPGFVHQISGFDEEEPQMKIVKQRKRISILNSNGIDADSIFGFGKRTANQKGTNRRISISNRLTRMFGVTIVEDYDGESLFENLPSYLAFLILGFSVVFNSLIVPLFISIPEITWSRNGWRFLFQALILVPFVLHEKRTGNQHVKNCYKWSSCFASQNIRQLFLSSINTSLNTTMFIVFSDYNYIANNCLLQSMTNFWLSVSRAINNERRHKIELTGQLMCLVGIGIITFDCFAMTEDDIPPKILTKYMLNDHFFIDPWQKVMVGILAPILVAIVTTQISLYTQDLKDVYPPYLQLFLISIFTSINLQSVGYFMYCTRPDTTHFIGWFGYIYDGAFSKFMYIGTVFNFGIFFTQFLMAQLYEPIIPASAQLLEPPFTAFFMDVYGIQYMPSSISAVGYILILPGQFIIILGQYLLEKIQTQSRKQSQLAFIRGYSSERKKSNLGLASKDVEPK